MARNNATIQLDENSLQTVTGKTCKYGAKMGPYLHGIIPVCVSQICRILKF